MSKPFTSKHRQESKTSIMKFRKDSSRSDHGVRGNITAIDHTIDLSQLFLGPRFAQGAHSQIYHGTYKDEPVAVKITQIPNHDDGKLGSALEKQFNREVTLVSRLQHPHVIKFIAAYKQDTVNCIVTEYLSGGSLRGYLNKLRHEKTCLSFQKMTTIALEIARGMEYVHSQGVIHRDLKPENVLIDGGSHMKIADFGVSCEEGSSRCDQFNEVGTYRWMAPEMIKNKCSSRKVDVYSFGLMMYEMVSGSVPYEGMNPVQVAYGVAHKNLRPDLPKECPDFIVDLIQRCWSSDPKKRPEFWQIVKVLEKFETLISCDGTLKLVQRSVYQDQNKKKKKKGLLHWIFHHGSVVHVN